MLPRFPKLITYLSLLLLGGVFLGPLVTYATLTLDSTSITTDDTLKLKGGNVGVGNITPTSNLHVSGTLTVTATSTLSGASTLTGAVTLSNPSTNSLIYTNSSGVITALASSTAGKILTASGTAPYFSWETTGSLANLTLTGPSTNSPIYLNSAGLIASLASSTAGKVLMATSTAPYFSWETDATGGTVSTLVADANNEITVGSTTSALTVNIANVANTALHTINIGGASAATTTLNILSGAGTQGASTLNLGNSRQVSTIALGNGDPSSALTINIGSGSTGATSTSINMGNGTAANTITLGAGTGGHTINIGTGTTTAKTINIGTANQVQNTITIGNASSSIALSGTLRITEGNQGASKSLYSDASGGATWQTPSSSLKTLTKITTAVTVNNTVTETDLVNYTVPANTLGTDKMLEIVGIGTLKNNTGGARNIRFKLKFGGTTILDTNNVYIGTSASDRDFHFRARIFNIAAANVQRGEIEIFTSEISQTAFTTGIGASTNGVAAAPFGLWAFGVTNGTVAIDTTAAQAVQLTVTLDLASASYEARMHYAIVTVTE